MNCPRQLVVALNAPKISDIYVPVKHFGPASWAAFAPMRGQMATRRIATHNHRCSASLRLGRRAGLRGIRGRWRGPRLEEGRRMRQWA